MSSDCSSKCSDCQTRKHRTIKSCGVSANRPSPDPTLIVSCPIFWKDNQVQVISLHQPLRNSPSVNHANSYFTVKLVYFGMRFTPSQYHIANEGFVRIPGSQKCKNPIGVTGQGSIPKYIVLKNLLEGNPFQPV